MAFFPPGKGCSEGVGYSYKKKGILLHSITDANGMPIVAITIPEGGDERQQVLPMKRSNLVGRRGNPRTSP